MSPTNNIKYSLIGHRGRCFDVRFSDNYKYILSASEDGTARLWNVSSRKAIATLTHGAETEVLRSMFVSNTGSSVICTCGSDGSASLWRSPQELGGSSDTPLSYSKTHSLSHEDQIYACESLSCVPSANVLTASSDRIYLWDIGEAGRDEPQSIQFVSAHQGGTEDGFGGPRNPDNKAFVFDAKPAMPSGTESAAPDIMGAAVAVALSDGTVRVVDLRTPDSALNFLIRSDSESSGSYATAVCWSPDKLSIVSTMGCGDVALLDLRTSRLRAYIRSAHSSACFGSVFKASNDTDSSSQCATWSSDGSLRVWDMETLQGVCSADHALGGCTLPGYPIYCAAAGPSSSSELIVGGGGSDFSFVGVLVHSVKVWV